MKNKRYLSASLALMLVLAMLAGCGNTTSSTEEISSAVTESGTETTQTAEEEPATATEADAAVSAAAAEEPAAEAADETAEAEEAAQQEDETTFMALVEIPAGSNIKYETDSTGQIVVDRFMSMSVTYPENYGSVVGTAAEDGDPLDVLILTREALNPGSRIECRPIGLLNMIDGGETDTKLIAVPVSSVDSTYDDIQDIEDLPSMEKERIEDFFDTYKLLQNKEVETDGYENAAAACECLKAAQDAYTEDEAASEKENLNNYAQSENLPDEIQVAVEISAGSNVKYELDSMGNVIADRFVSASVAYPANYGSAVSTTAGDGDPLDVLVFTRTPVYPGTVITCRPIGYLDMTDDGEADPKIIAVPTDSVDATYADIQSIEDLPELERQRVEQFFVNYKNLPEGKNKVETAGYQDCDAAKALISEAAAAFQASEEESVNLNDYPQTDDSPETLNVVIEIPQDTSIKYELDEDGNMIADRFMSMSVVYPANYGFVPQTVAEDGDPLDVLVYTREALISGSVVTVRPIGVLHMTDGGETDDKIIAVPTSDVDPTYDEILSVEDLPEIELGRLEQFFQVYKLLQNKEVETDGFEGVEAAEAIIEQAFLKD